ncbi:large ribosomal subunit protein bL28c [Malania oleifera]|uniref:large ribosomal subunit protein bL28c n=1 Tax=Malania oleifera TaxID=397392 RepID=UPI0025ADE59C|nr:large ribosomal subunit protein bL28c [Malania oleifera]
MPRFVLQKHFLRTDKRRSGNRRERERERMAAAASVLMVGHCSNLCFRKADFLNRASVKLNAVSELGFVTSQLGGVRISPSIDLAKRISAPARFLPLQPVARRVCPFTGKKANRANRVSFSNHKTKRLQFVNLQYKRIWWEAGKRYIKMRLSTKALKTIEKNGLDAVAKKAGIDLRKK